MEKIFGTDGIRCIVNQEPMTAETCLKIAKTTGYFLATNKKQKKKVLISKDTRLSGYLFEPLLTAGFISMGMDVILLGPLPTPGIAYVTKALRAACGIVISASHHPFYENGVKIFGPDGHCLSADQECELKDIFTLKACVLVSLSARASGELLKFMMQ